LSQGERYTVAIYLKQGMGPSAIARELGEDTSTISRELRRNRQWFVGSLQRETDFSNISTTEIRRVEVGKKS